LPALVGIAGPSGSGKTALSRELARALDGRASVLSLDSYYRELSHLPIGERELVNFDHPDSLDWPLFLDHLKRLGRGEPVPEPVYLFAEHTRADAVVPVEARDVVLVEGILVLHRADVRERFALRVYVETPDQVCRDRRLDRDTRERGRTAESVERQYALTVLPMAELYVWPSRRWADVVVSGQEPFDSSVARVLEALRLNTATTRP
jgi:uridine kinase